MAREFARPLKPWRSVAGAYRGGQVYSVSANTLTIRLQAEHHATAMFNVARTLAPTAIVGDAIVARIGNLPAAIGAFQIVELRGGNFVPPAPGRDQAASVQAGIFSPAHVEYALTDETDVLDWGPLFPR